MKTNNRMITKFKNIYESVPTNFTEVMKTLDRLEILEKSKPQEAYRQCDELYDALLNQYSKKFTNPNKNARDMISKFHTRLYNQLNQSEEKA